MLGLDVDRLWCALLEVGLLHCFRWPHWMWMGKLAVAAMGAPQVQVLCMACAKEQVLVLRQISQARSAASGIFPPLLSIE